ncbi:MAG: DJ-1/PfpI family protein [Deltaproteobacteria bacterium]|nr:DJ-1/PfpI family protein [Deltaproteobacteria bacterium]
MKKKVLIPVADGVEEIEAVTQIDILRRAGAEVTVASVNRLNIIASRGVKLEADCLIGELKETEFDLISLPGGLKGAENLRDSAILIGILKKQQSAGRLYGAICASPAVVFEPHGLLGDKKATCYPDFSDKLKNKSDARVVFDQGCVTGKGPGAALEYSLKLVELLFGEARVQELKEAMVIE